MKVAFLRVHGLEVNGKLKVRQHARLWVSGPVVAKKNGDVAVVRVSDWELFPTCRHCGGLI